MRYLYILYLLFFVSSCSMTIVNDEPVNGVSFVATRSPIDQEHVSPVTEVNANYAAVMPFGFLRDINSHELMYNTERQWYGETLEGAAQYIGELRKQDIKIMLKPQIWVWRGEYTGSIEMETEQDWVAFERSYSEFILDYAKLAADHDVEIFCIATELDKFVSNRSEYWLKLIEEIKSIYKGKLTYAANWDEFKRINFWDQLDFIGIDAYFPVSESKTPSVEECMQGWQPHKLIIEKKAKEFNKPVLFTEFGYRSVDFTGKEPWNASRYDDPANLEAQTNATTALFNTFWNEPWFSGGFIWKWFHNDQRAGGPENNRFTPQNKPVEDVIKATYLQK